MSYQKVTGTLMASGYAKLGTQEAMNDMFVVEGACMSSNWDGTQTAPTLTQNNANGAQRMPDKENFNCWTNIGAWVDTKGKPHKESSDSARYKALGNSIALPFWFWLLRRISAEYETPATLGSLFDGISGFPLCWERCNGIGTAKWSSEIEEFPIAVCKKHFGDEDAGAKGDIREFI